MTRAGDFARTALAGDGSDVIGRALGFVRRHLDMEVAYLSEFDDGNSVFRVVDAPGYEKMVWEGHQVPLDTVYCQHIVDGSLPQLIRDTSKEPLAAAMPITAAVPIGSHASVPIRRADGSVYGMFCCLSPRVRPDLTDRDLEVLHAFAGIAGDQINGSIAEHQRRDGIATLIRTAMRWETFDIALQPICDLRTGVPTGYEALCRFWGQTYRPPNLWFDDAAEVGLLNELECRVIAAALRLLPSLDPDVYLSVNASPETVLSGDLPDILDGAPADRIVVELTEHAEVPDVAALISALGRLRATGVRLAVDDAGAGYSGLQKIIAVSPDIIKLDLSLTRGIDENVAQRSLARAMVAFGEEVGARIVAEGIETEEEARTLRDIGVGYGQGYLLGRPELRAPAGGDRSSGQARGAA